MLGASRDVGDNTLDVQGISVTVPVYYIWGVRDTWVGKESVEQIKDHFPDFTYLEIDSAHLPMEEVPSEFNLLLDSVL